MANNITKTLMIYISISIIFYGAGFKLIDNENFLSRFVDIQENEGITNIAPGFIEGTIPTTFEESGIGIPGLNLIDGLRTIISFLGFLINISFAPLAILGALRLDPLIILLIGIPLFVSYIMGAISLIRSGA